MSDFDVRYSALRRAVIEPEFQRMNDMQLQAVLKTEGPLLLLAGAGSGKTTVLINRIINLLRFGRAYECEEAPAWAGDDELRRLAELVNDESAASDEELRQLCAVEPPRPYEIIAITFTNKAAGELKERLNVACGEAANDIWAHTFHSACIQILRSHIEKLGYAKNFTIYDDDDRKKLVTNLLKELGYDEKKFDARVIMNEISRAKDNLFSWEEYTAQVGEDYYRKVVARIYELYQKRMQTANALDFDDIICKTVELLESFEEVRAYYQRKFRYVLVDEYQDTNYAQYKLCSLLAGGYRNFCVVGDDDQSIYKFRGATIANILEFEDQYPDAVTIRLEQNYRSTSNILNAANGVIARNLGRKGKTLWTENGTGAKVQLYCGETQEEEAQYIAKMIYQGYSKGEKLKNFTVLYRNHALSNAVEMAFKRNAIPYRIVSGLRFFDRAEVKDMLAYLWVVSNPADAMRLRRIINTPARKIGAKAVETIAALAQREGTSEFDIICRAPEFPELSRSCDSVMRFGQLISELRMQKEEDDLITLYEAVMEKTGYLASLQAQTGEDAQVRIDNIMELKSNILEYCQRNEQPTLEGFLEEVSLITDIDRYDTEADTVTMMTMHSAKGLEFDNVFLCGAEEGLFPSYRSMENEAEVEEERRLCYVAMTRAKKVLHITCAKRRMLYGQTSYAKPSRFIAEVPSEFIEEYRPTPAYAPRPKREKPVYQRPSISASFGGARQPAQAFRIGEKIRHKAFGVGMIKATTPMGGDTLLEIAFETAGTKMMMAKTASQFIQKL